LLRALYAHRASGLSLVHPSECRVPPDLAPLEPSEQSLAVVRTPPSVPYRDVAEAVMLVPRP
jgi:hypothetical protein